MPGVGACTANRSSTPCASRLRTIATPSVCGPAGIVERRAARAAPEHGRALAVHGDLDFFVAAERLEAEAAAAAPDANLVLGVERKHVPDAHAAARAERLAVHMLGLHEAARRAIGRETDARARVADGEPADFARRPPRSSTAAPETR